MPTTISGTSGILDNSGAFIRGTAVASTSGTSIDFTGIPSWVKRITVMFNGVSLNGTGNYLIQIGSGSVDTTTNYTYTYVYTTASGLAALASTAGPGVVIVSGVAASLLSGNLVITNINGNNWVFSGVSGGTSTNFGSIYTGNKSLSGVLDRVRITTNNGTDTFDAGTINILYE